MHDTNPYQPNKLRLQDFKDIYKQTSGLPAWLRHLILGLLFWLEDRYITAKVTQTIDDAVKDYHEQAKTYDAPHWLKDAKVSIIENPDSTHQLPTLSISAPYKRGDET